MNLFEVITVDELLFKGAELPQFDFRIPFIPKTENLTGTLYEILSQLGKDVSFLEPNRFGLFFEVNLEFHFLLPNVTSNQI